MVAVHGVEVDLWAAPSDSRLDVPGVQVRDLAQHDWESSAAGYDRVVYNLGNNPEFHRAVFDAYLAVPGIVVMHDRSMLSFFLGWLALERRVRPPYPGAARFLAMMKQFYGVEGKDAATRLMLSESLAFETDDERKRFTLVEPCLANAVGLVTHSESALREMSARAPSHLPATRLSLPFVDEGLMPDGGLLTRRELGLPQDKWVLVSSGLLHPSKRVDLLLLAVARSPLLRERVLVVAVGDTRHAGTYEVQLRELAHEMGLDDSLLITGALDPRQYFSYIQASDACAALRNAGNEAASATLAEQLHFGKPTLVNRTGVFAEMPDDVVIKIDTQDEVGSTMRALESLVENPDLAARYVVRAREYAKAELSAAGYAEGLLRFFGTLDCSARLMDEVQEAGADLLGRARARSLDRLSSEYANKIASTASCG